LYILQKNLFSFEQFLEMEPESKLTGLFKVLELEPYAKLLRTPSPQGAKGYNRIAILRAFIAAPLEGIDNFSALNSRLRSDIRFKYYCGFKLTESVPSVSVFSRVFKQIVEKDLAEKLFYDLVEKCSKEGLIDGSTIAIDSTAIDAYEKKQPKKNCKNSENATWGAKFDSFKNKLTWFGYKLHLAVDAKSELPVALEVTSAHVNDGDVFIPLVKNVLNQKYLNKLNYVLADAGYDRKKNYEYCLEANAQAIIPLNARNEKEPPAGFASNGTPKCSMGYEMVYWGHDKKHLKFRCPHVLRKVDCPYGTQWCSSSNYGMVAKVKVSDDPRRFSMPHRESKGWNELYKQRTSVERCNSRLKEYLTVNDLHLGGIHKVAAYAFINAIVLLASALAVKNAKTICSEAA